MVETKIMVRTDKIDVLYKFYFFKTKFRIICPFFQSITYRQTSDSTSESMRMVKTGDQSYCKIGTTSSVTTRHNSKVVAVS